MRRSRASLGLFGSAVALAALGAAACRGPAPVDLPDGTPVVLISVDTLRSDRLPAYGYDRVATPNLDAFTRESVVFAHAYSHCPLTLPSHATILTGLLPPAHGVRQNREAVLTADHPTLAERLRQHGYRTGGFVSSMVLRATTGMARGFEHYDDGIAEGPAFDAIQAFGQRRGAETVERALGWLDPVGHDGRWFLFVHLFDPHAPYDPPEPHRSAHADPYDAEVAYVDAVVGTLFDRLRAASLYDRALILFLSDHGEGLGDHVEREHGIFLYREALQVPLIVKLPGSLRGGTRVADPVALYDVVPTVLDLLGSPTEGLPGWALFGGTTVPRRTIYGETQFPRYQYRWAPLRSVIDGDLHYIEAPRPELYDLAHDPGERDDLTARRDPPPSLLDALAAVGPGIESTAEVSAEELDRLASLGYIGGAGEPEPGTEFPDPKDGIAAVEEMWTQVRRAEETGALDAVEAALARMNELGIRDVTFNRAIASQLLRAHHAEAAIQVLLPFADDPDPETALALGMALEAAGRFNEALDRYRAVPRIHAGAARAALGEAMALVRLGRWREAAAALEGATRDFPDQPAFVHALARILAASPDDRVRDGERALALLEPLWNTDRSTGLAETIAMALAEVGRFDEALALQQSAIDLALRSGRDDIAHSMTPKLEHYRTHQPWRGNGDVFQDAFSGTP